jgi:hypothetical protein
MAKILNLGPLFLTLAVFAIGASLTFVGLAFADDQDNRYSHQHITASWDHNLVCGDHKCVPGETPQPPQVIVPVKGVV